MGLASLCFPGVRDSGCTAEVSLANLLGTRGDAEGSPWLSCGCPGT